MNENLKAFLQKVSENPELQTKLTEISDSVMVEARTKFIRLAEENGYKFTDEDMNRVFSEKERLSEDELNDVAGGAYTKKSPSGKPYSDCNCILGGIGEADKIQKKCVCILGGCGELTALGKEKANKGEIRWSGDENAKVAMFCAVGGTTILYPESE